MQNSPIAVAVEEPRSLTLARAAKNTPWKRWLPGWIALLLLLASGGLFLTHDGFSYRCHPDEPGKVEQIAAHTRNFNHPLLMLNAVQVVFDCSGLRPTPQNIVRVGRAVSGVFSVLTVLAFAAAAYVMAGPLAAVLCGLFLLGAPLFVEVAHYLKEDPSMMFGLSLSFLALALYQQKQGAGRLCFMAAGAALAASGKHVGVVVLPFCIYEICRHEGGWKRLPGFLGGMVLVYAFVNYQMVSHFFGYLGGLHREVGLIQQAGGRPEVQADFLRPFKKYRMTLLSNVPLPVVWFAIWGSWVAFRAKLRAAGYAVILGVALFTILCLTPKTAARYVLPVICMTCLAAAVGAAWLWRKPSRPWRWAGFALPLALALGISAARVSKTYGGIGNDSRRQMAEWILQNIPPGAVIAQDELGLLENSPESPYHVPQPLYNAGSDIRVASMAALKSGGVCYAVLVSRSLGRKKKAALARENQGEDPLFRRLPHCEKVWQSSPHIRVANVNPYIVIYRLPGDVVLAR